MSAASVNPLLLEWIKEWYDLARERNSKGVTTYKRAYDSMKACPLTFTHPSEAQQLDGIGPKICGRLTEKLKDHCEANGLTMPKKGKRKRQTGEELPESILEDGAPASAKKPRKKKPYIPALRSGAYALVLALSSIPEDSLQSLSKADLQVLAQPHCDSSFTVPSEANKFYTAWSSMKTLVDKDLVQEKGRPTRKYYLSDEGWEVARRIKAVHARNDRTISETGIPNDISDRLRKKPSMTKPTPKLLSHDVLDLEGGSGKEIPVPIPQTYPAGQRLGTNPQDYYGTFPFPPERALHLRAKSNVVNLLSSPEPEPPGGSSSAELENRPMLKHASKTSPKKPSASQTLYLVPSAERAKVNLSTRSDSLTSFDSIRLQPGTFTVQLVLDTREVRAKNDRDYIHDELVKKGIKPILRALELGDFFWVAKMNDPSILARYGEAGEPSDELALDWIVERKRLDDLVGSLTDGRFSEQKFRLKKSGIKNVIYLIEDFTLSSEKETRFHEAIQTVIASTQVVSGYFVKRTQKLDDTIRYIARMTRMLKDLYESKPLYLIPTNTIEGDSYLPLLQLLRSNPGHPSRSYQLTYPTFASISSKTDNLTLRDVFMKMLMCTRGIGADKVLALQKIFSTPRALVEALEACSTERERDTMVSDKMDGVIGRAKIKGVLSQKIARIWGEE